MKKRGVIDRIEDGIMVLLFEDEGKEMHLQVQEWQDTSVKRGTIVEITIDPEGSIQQLTPLEAATAEHLKRVSKKRKRLAGRSPGSRFKKK